VWEAAYEPAVGLTLTAATGLTLGLGGYLVWHNQLTIGALTAFTMYLGQLIWPMFAAGWVLSLIERGRAAWQRLQPMLDAPLAIDDHGTLTVPAGPLSLQRQLRLRRTERAGHQRYHADAAAGPDPRPGRPHRQRQVDAAARAAAPADAATRQRAVERPRARPVQLHALRAAISWVPQESFLFSASIADNIALARPDATRAQVEHAASWPPSTTTSCCSRWL
jgi:ATP-binding cassette subfamily B protein/ATP-binding cassette subfamily C protein/ATP-binding cassette subfamily B multidrug efflux pump